MDSPSLSVIIRCYNEEKHIGKLLYGITQQTFQDYEIIVVDSGSTDQTVQIAEQFPIRLISIRPEDFSFGRALNLGCQEAKGSFLLFASAHVYPSMNTWFEKMLAPFEHDEVAAVYGKQRGAPETYFSEHRVFARWFPEQSMLFQKTPFCNNANCVIRRSLWEQEPYDEELPGLEDLAWAKKMMEKGFRISYAAEAEIIHVHSETPKQIFNRYMREAIALKQIFPEQDMSFPSFLRLWSQSLLSDYLHLFVEGEVDWKELRHIAMFRTMQFWGSFQGFRQSGPLSERLKRTFYYPDFLPRRKQKGKGLSQQMIDYSRYE